MASSSDIARRYAGLRLAAVLPARDWWVVVTLRVLVITAIVGVWEYLAATGQINTFFMSQPSVIFGIFWGWVADGSIFRHIAVTLFEASLGFGLALLTGVPIGFVLARNRLVDRVFQPFVDVLNATPRIALVSLFVLWLGLGIASKVALVYSVVVFIFIINTYGGIKSVDQEFVRTARLLGASRTQIDTKVVLPWTIPWIFAGVRLGVAFGLSAAVVSEIVAANHGLGFLVAQHTSLLNTSGAFAALFALMIVAYALNKLPEVLEARLLRWRSVSVDARPQL